MSGVPHWAQVGTSPPTSGGGAGVDVSCAAGMDGVGGGIGAASSGGEGVGGVSATNSGGGGGGAGGVPAAAAAAAAPSGVPWPSTYHWGRDEEACDMAGPAPTRGNTAEPSKRHPPGPQAH